MRQGPTPRGAWEFECQLEQTLREVGRQVVEHTYNAAEPEQPSDAAPRRVRLGRREFRRNRKTPNKIATLFGVIVLRRTYYQAVQPGRRGLAPLERRLGIVARLATPALADEAAQLAAERTQTQTCQALERRHGVHWSQGSLRRVVAAMARHYAPLRHEAQVDQLLKLLRKAAKSRGRHAPTLSVGRDGVMIPTRPCWEEASTATVSVCDRRGRRLGTVYLGRMPQSGQGTLTAQILTLLRDLFTRWTGEVPRLSYVTDAGTHPQDFFRHRLRHMKHPRTGQPLVWEWIVDYYHACERITLLAEGLFGSSPEGSRWAHRMRVVLRDQPGGVTRVVQTAQALRRHRGLKCLHQKFPTALAYLKKYTDQMDYAGARRRRLPIGSGITEAACKTIFGYRFKQSGMRWKRQHGQHVLDLRLVLKSDVWEACRNRWLTAIPPLEPLAQPDSPPQSRKSRQVTMLPA